MSRGGPSPNSQHLYGDDVVGPRALLLTDGDAVAVITCRGSPGLAKTSGRTHFAAHQRGDGADGDRNAVLIVGVGEMVWVSRLAVRCHTLAGRSELARERRCCTAFWCALSPPRESVLEIAWCDGDGDGGWRGRTMSFDNDVVTLVPHSSLRRQLTEMSFVDSALSFPVLVPS